MKQPTEEPFKGQSIVNILQQDHFSLDELKNAMERVAYNEYQKSNGQSAWLFAVDNFIKSCFQRGNVLNDSAREQLSIFLKNTARTEWTRLDALDSRIVQKQFETKQGAFAILGDFPVRLSRAMSFLPTTVRTSLGHLIEKDLKLSGRCGSQVLTGLEEILKHERSVRPNIDIILSRHPTTLGQIQNTLKAFNVPKPTVENYWAALLAV